jgi:hypothetical protein
VERLTMTLDAQKILDSIQKLSDMLYTLSAKLDVLIVDDLDRGSKVDGMYKLFVTGNGTPSFQERVRILETFMESCKTETAIKKQESRKLMWLILGFVVPILLALLGEVIIFYVRVYPLLVSLIE